MSERVQAPEPSETGTALCQIPENSHGLTSADLAAVIAVLTGTDTPAVTFIEGSEEGQIF